MKIKTLFLLIIFPCILNAQEIKFSISGNISLDDEKVDMVFLRYLDDNDIKLDSAQVIDDKFNMSGVVTQPVAARFFARGTLPIYAGEDAILYLSSAPLNIEVVSSTKESSYTKKEYLISGGDQSTIENNILNSLLDKIFEKENAEFGELYDQLSPEERAQAVSNPKISSLLDRFRAEKYDAIEELIKKYPSSEVLMSRFFDFVDYSNPEVDRLEELFSHFDEEMRNSIYGEKQKAVLKDIKSRQVGRQATNFTLTSNKGEEISLSDYKGEYVLLDFWASWCRPCRIENPNLIKLYNAEINGKKVQIVGVSIDDSSKNWVKAIEEDKLPWTQLLDTKDKENGKKVSEKYFIYSIPQNFLINPDGIIIAKDIRGPEIIDLVTPFIK